MSNLREVGYFQKGVTKPCALRGAKAFGLSMFLLHLNGAISLYDILLNFGAAKTLTAVSVGALLVERTYSTFLKTFNHPSRRSISMFQFYLIGLKIGGLLYKWQKTKNSLSGTVLHGAKQC